MNRITQILTLSFLLIFGLVAIWAYQNFYTISHRYRLTVEVSVDGQVKTGSSVIEIQWKHYPSLGMFNQWGCVVLGQSPFVDMGKHGAIVVLLGAHPPSDNFASAKFVAMRALGSAQARSKNEYPISLETLTDFSHVTGRAELSENHLPKFLWFVDATDLAAGKFVLPHDFESTIAPDVHFIRAAVEITNDPISVGLNEKLPFLYELYEKQRKNGEMGIVGGSRFDATTVFGASK